MILVGEEVRKEKIDEKMKIESDPVNPFTFELKSRHSLVFKADSIRQKDLLLLYVQEVQKKQSSQEEFKSKNAQAEYRLPTFRGTFAETEIISRPFDQDQLEILNSVRKTIIKNPEFNKNLKKAMLDIIEGTKEPDQKKVGFFKEEVLKNKSFTPQQKQEILNKLQNPVKLTDMHGLFQK